MTSMLFHRRLHTRARAIKCVCVGEEGEILGVIDTCENFAKQKVSYKHGSMLVMA